MGEPLPLHKWAQALPARYLGDDVFESAVFHYQVGFLAAVSPNWPCQHDSSTADTFVAERGVAHARIGGEQPPKKVSELQFSLLARYVRCNSPELNAKCVY